MLCSIRLRRLTAIENQCRMLKSENTITDEKNVKPNEKTPKAMMELKQIAGIGMLMGMVWLGTGTSVRSQEVSVDANKVEEELLQVEALRDSTVPERVIQERLAKLQNEIPLRYHKVTHQFVEYFIYKKPDFVRRMLEQMNLFFPLYEQTLEKYGMPRELKFLSLIESGLNPRIISYAGAGGLWQFMPATGRE